jgi:hypothetical protein
LPDQHDQVFAAGDAGIEKIPLQHGVMLRENRDDDGGLYPVPPMTESCTPDDRQLDMAALAIVYGLRSLISQPRGTSGTESEPSAVASIAGGERPTTIIVSTPNSNDCRRCQLNVDTGARNDQGPINCNADSSKQPRRLEAISKAFRNH